jgi:hypothetical protein
MKPKSDNPPRKSTVRDVVYLALIATLLPFRVNAFALLGPYEDWMTPVIGYHVPGDIGGPMDIGEGYRWNVPVVSYAFDQSFLNYFGSNGVAAVEGAIAILNELPPASQIPWTNFPITTLGMNYRADNAGLFDLKLYTLALLLEQMGLAQPTRYVLTMRRWDPTLVQDGLTWSDEFTWPPGTIPNLILPRNFDPGTLLPSQYVNGVPYTGYLRLYSSVYPTPDLVFVTPVPLDPTLLQHYDPIADFSPSSGYYSTPGLFGTGLTRDDAGGLRYLLSSNNVALETLLPDVRGWGRDAKRYVNVALRPGIEKITFVRQQFDPRSGRAVPIKIKYQDTYLVSGVGMHQRLEREVAQPDFLFCAGDTGKGLAWTPNVLRTGTSNWWNSASVTGSTNAGPGIIRPTVRITFNTFWPTVWTSDLPSIGGTQSPQSQWGSFDATTNAPIAYPVTSAPISGPLTVRFRLHSITSYYPSAVRTLEWSFPNCARAAFQVSTDLVHWTSKAVLTNTSPIVEWDHLGLAQPREFFRVLPQ